MLLEIDATATISTFPSSLNGFDFAPPYLSKFCREESRIS